MEKGEPSSDPPDYDEEEKFLGECSKDKEDDEPMEKAALNESGSSGTDADVKQSQNKSVGDVVGKFLDCVGSVYVKYKTILGHIFLGLLIAAYSAYFIASLVYDLKYAIPLIVITAVVLFIILWEMLIPKVSFWCSSTYNENCDNSSKAMKKIFYWIQIACALIFCIVLFVSIAMRNPSQLISLVGLGLIVFFCFIFSKYPNDVSWRPVAWGIGLQFILGLLVLRTEVGFVAFSFIGNQIAAFMNFADIGSIFVFGEAFKMHFFAFKVLPMIIFFSTVANMLYYIGAMQWLVGKLSFVMQTSLGTSAIESTVAIANIFVGMTEAPLVVRPYLKDLTDAELHSVLTSGLGSIAFSVYGAYVAFGVDQFHLLTACVMSAPASLAISRLLFPEKKRSKFMTSDSLHLSEGTDRNIIEAAAVGASMAIGLVANIGANLIAFMALLGFINSSLGWFGSFVGFDELSFDLICGYLFMPVAFLMGAEWEDCFLVGELFGTKTFLNEFVAYAKMESMIDYRQNGSIPKVVNGTVQYMSLRSEIVAIHALCGFCNISSLGIIIGGLGALVPSKKKELAELALRSLIGGMLTCCMTACIASLLFVEPTSLPIIDGNLTTGLPLLDNSTAVAPLLRNITTVVAASIPVT